MKTICTWVAMLTLGGTAFGDVPKRPTFGKDVAPILYQNCIGCHREGQSGPMSLITYDEVRPWAKAIHKNVSERIMPPWHADEGIGHFSNNRSLSEDEVETIVRWVKNNAPRGKRSDLPAAPHFDDSWALGQPDHIVTFDEVKVPGGGPDRFHDLVVKTDFPEDKWIAAIEVLPSNPRVAHHVIVYQLGVGENSPQGWLGAWAAGMDPMVFAKGTGRILKKGATLVGDMHYHPTEEDAVDQTRMGLHFADADDIEKEVVNLWIQNSDFKIPAGNPSYKARATFTFQQDSYVVSLLPHMHYRGKSFHYTAKYPDGRKEKLLSVSNYDFAWQTLYHLEEPLFMPKGTRIDCLAEWDNSADNPNNPDPTRDVTFGSESFDEMLIGFVDYIVAEGVRPVSAEVRLEALQAEWTESKDAHLYRLDAIEPDNDGEPNRYPGVAYLPPTGNGEWHIAARGVLQQSEVRDIQWDGDAFSGTVIIPNLGTYTFSGQVDPTTGNVTGSIPIQPGFTLALKGHRIK